MMIKKKETNCMLAAEGEHYFGCFSSSFFSFVFSHLFSQGNRTYCLAKTRQVKCMVSRPQQS